MRKITANIKRVVRTRGYFLRARRTRGYFLNAVLIRRAHGPQPSWFQLAECGLTMHPEKSKIVYCKDSNRTQLYPQVYFTFLGFTFQPRKALSKQCRIFTSFLPVGGVRKESTN
jgi:hypothetical protein